MTKVNKNNEKGIIKLNANNSEQLKKYFETVFKLSKSGKPHPVDLEDVWPLAYSEKGTATRSLKRNFIENIDFITVDQAANGGRFAEIKYKLSLSCMEFFVARKVRPVFDIYRQVTHRASEAFTNYSNIADHQKLGIQKQNSKDVNAFNYFNGGVDDLREYNRENCKEHTGKKPSEWKQIGKDVGLKSKDRTSGKQVVRNLMPEAACGMSFVDNLVKQGYPVEEAMNLSRQFAMPLFKGLLDMGVVPNELHQ